MGADDGNENQTHKVRNEEADETLVEGINHVHPEHVWLIFLQDKRRHSQLGFSLGTEMHHKAKAEL